MKEQNEKEKPIKMKRKWNNEKKFYLATAIGCAVMLLAIVVTAVLVIGGESDIVIENPNSGISSELPNTSEDNNPVDSENSADQGGEQGGVTDDEQVSGLPDGFIAPIQAVSVSNSYGFYYNQTLNSYYEHKGMDFVADAGTEVMAVESGTVESIYKEDILLGTQITILHDNGVKSVYRFVNEAETLNVGDRVEKGEVIATVAEATGDEYKDGAHLHFAVEKDGKTVDPAQYLTLEEK